MTASRDDDEVSSEGLVEEPPASDALAGAAMMRRVSLRLFGEDVPPVTVGRFVVESRIGSGGMGDVHLARDPKLGRPVAIKLLRAREDRDETLPRRLEQEAHVLARLSHPNVVQVYEVGEHEGQVFLAMEYVDGGSLRDWLTEEPRSWREILDKYVQAGAGLAAAHRVGIIHRDFKPANALVGKDGRVRVADFGLAREVASDPVGVAERSSVATPTGTVPETLTRSGAVVGTLAYMSPEQLAGQSLDVRSDLFAFCVALWEALTGNRPYRPEQLRRAMVEPAARVPAPLGVLPGPRWLGAALRRGLAIDPERRWSSMGDLLAALQDAPVRRRRVVASLGVVTMGIGGWVAWEQRGPDPCPSAEGELVGVWDEERRAALGVAVVASGLSFGPEVWRVAEAGLDRYAQTWLEARQETCEATRLEGRQSEEQLDLSVACLDRRRIALQATVDLLGDGRIEAWAGATDLIAALPPIEPCTRTDDLRREDRPRSVRTEATDALDRRMADAHAHLTVQLFDDAHRIAQLAIGDAQRLGDGHRLAEALYVRGQAEGMLGEGARALASLNEAVDRGLEVDDDELVARGFIALGQVEVVELEDAERAGQELSHAAAIVARGHAANDVRIALAIARAEVASLEGRHDDALEELQAARRWVTDDEAQDIVLVSKIAKVLGERGSLDESDAHYLEAMERQSRWIGGGHPATAHWRMSMAINELERPKPDLERAERLSREALEGYRAVYGAHDRRLAGILVLLGSVAWGRGHLEDAEARARQAVEIVRDVLPLGHSERAGALALLANVLVERGRYDEAIDLHRELLREHEAGRGRRELPNVRQNLAWLLCRVQRCAGAQQQIDAARSELSAGDDLHVLLDVVQGMVMLERGDAVGAVQTLESAMSRVDQAMADAHPLLRPELAAAQARALAAEGRDLVRARALAVEAREGHRALGRDADADAIDAWLLEMDARVGSKR